MKHIWCKSECKFDGGKCNSNQKWSEYKNPIKHCLFKKDIWNPSTCEINIILMIQ